MENNPIPCEEIDVRPFAYAISLVDGKWKMHRLSEKGESIMPILRAFCQWGHEHMPEGWK